MVAHGWIADKYWFSTAGLCVGGRANYIDILLGPERTRECFFFQESDDRQALQVKPQVGVPLFLGVDSSGLVSALGVWLCVV